MTALFRYFDNIERSNFNSYWKCPKQRFFLYCYAIITKNLSSAETYPNPAGQIWTLLNLIEPKVSIRNRNPPYFHFLYKGVIVGQANHGIPPKILIFLFVCTLLFDWHNQVDANINISLTASITNICLSSLCINH